MPTARSIRSGVICLVVALMLSADVAHLSGISEPADAGSAVAIALRAQDVAGPGPAGSSAATALAAPAVPLLTPDERDMVAWARSRFALVGLDLPDVDVSFHDDTRPCQGHDGLYRRDHDRPRVRVCVPDPGTFAFTLQRQRTLVHELAHAWEQANLDDDERSALLEIVGAEDWYAPEAAWEERGAERFAETIVWGLYDQLRRPTLIDVSCRDLHADFRAITGATAPGPLEAVCHLDETAPHHDKGESR